MRTALTAIVCLAAMTAPGLAIDWPIADTPMLELSNATMTARFPAPAWIDRASHEETVTDAVNARATWRVLGGFDLVAEQIDASLDAGDTWDVGPLGYLNDVFFDDCDFMHREWADLADGEKSTVIFLSYALCGYDLGNASGGMFIGLSIEAGPDQIFDLWYVTPYAPFKISDASTWPMSAAEIEATARALAAAITITPR